MSVALARPRVVSVARQTAIGERAWLLGAIVAILGLCGLPYVLGAVFGPTDLDRLGTYWFNHDFSQYQAAMREGARSTSWLIHDHFSAEPHPAALMYPLYVAAGKFAAALHLSDVGVFAALEWLGRVSVVAAVYAFAASFVGDLRARRLALVLAIGTLGLDVWGVLLRAITGAEFLPTEVNPYLEVSSFGVLLSAPHLMLGLALTLLSAPLYLRAISGNRRAAVLLGINVAALSLVHSFNLPVLVSVLGVHALRTGRRAWLPAVIAGAAAAPMIAYSLLIFQRDPFWAGTYGAQNLMPAPMPWALPFDFGLVLLAAPLAWPVIKRWPTERRWLILLWIGLGLAWMYAPVTFQRRLSFGVQPALAVLGAIGLIQLNGWMTRRRVSGWQRRAVNYSATVAALSTSLLVYLALLASAVMNAPTPVYLWTKAEASAATWLGAHSSADDLVLASTTFANPLVGSIDGRVFEGHLVGTLDDERKQAMAIQFYAADTSVAEREAILRETSATVVAFGPHERELGATSLAGLPELHMMYDRDGVELYRVER